MLSSRRSQVFSRKGSIDRSRVSKFGVNGFEFWELRVEFSEVRDVGKSSSWVGGEAGSWWRKVVRRWELWTVTGSSRRISEKRRLVF